MTPRSITRHIVGTVLTAATLGPAAAEELSNSAPAAAEPNPHRYGIYTATISGNNVKRVLSDPRREINHARVSPDGKWITFTRYNHDANGDGLCEEGKDGYDLTEVMVCRVDGTDLQTALPPKKGYISANSYWLPDGKGVIAISAPMGFKGGGIVLLDLKTGEKRGIPTPGLIAGDPHLLGDRIVFTALKEGDTQMSLWLMRPDGSELRQLTAPQIEGTTTERPPLGDFDPKLSPDGTEAAFFRHLADAMWHLVVVDVKSGKERDLSPPDAQPPYCDAVPEWSPDGKRLIFWHVSLPLTNIGLYTMKPDGTDRRKIPLPKGYTYTFPVYFPGDNRGQEARIMYSAKEGGF